MKALFTFLSAMCIITGGLAAQDAKVVLNKLSEKAKSFKALEANYHMTLKDDKAGGIIAEQEGTATIKGEKFKLKMNDYHIFCDGETVWTWEKDGNVCYIDDYSELQDERGINPNELFTIWENGFKQEHQGSVTEEGKSLTKINLYPTDSDKEFHTISLLIDEAALEIKKAIIKGRDGQEMVYSIKSYNEKPSLTDSSFTFNKTAYPGVEIDDQRF